MEGETLLGIVLVLVIWLALSVLRTTIAVIESLFPFANLFGLLVVAVIGLWLLEYI